MRLEMDASDFTTMIREEAAKRMYAAAYMFHTNMKQQLSISYPPASVPGQFPHGRTWFGRNNLIVTPTVKQEIVDGGKVAIGFRKPAYYMVLLETEHDRLGLVHLFESMQSQLSAALVGIATAKSL